MKIRQRTVPCLIEACPGKGGVWGGKSAKEMEKKETLFLHPFFIHVFIKTDKLCFFDKFLTFYI